jgi:hypothetical protein
MQVHGLIALSIGGHLPEAGTTSFDLDFAASLLLDMLDICSALANNLSSKIETLDRLQINGNTLLGPFPLKETYLSTYSSAHGEKKKPGDLPVQIRLVPQPLVPVGGTGAHPRGWEVLAS